MQENQTLLEVCQYPITHTCIQSQVIETLKIDLAVAKSDIKAVKDDIKDVKEDVKDMKGDIGKISDQINSSRNYTIATLVTIVIALIGFIATKFMG